MCTRVLMMPKAGDKMENFTSSCCGSAVRFLTPFTSSPIDPSGAKIIGVEDGFP